MDGVYVILPRRKRRRKGGEKIHENLRPLELENWQKASPTPIWQFNKAFSSPSDSVP